MPSAASQQQTEPSKKQQQHPYVSENFWLDKYKYVEAEQFYAVGQSFFRRLLAGDEDSKKKMDQFMKRFDQLEKEQKVLHQMSADILQQLGVIQKQLGSGGQGSSGQHVQSSNANTSFKPRTTSTTSHQEQQKTTSASASQQQKTQPPVEAKKKDAKADDDDVDLFGSDEEEESEEAKKVREERLKQYAEKKSTKPVLIAKSNVILDVKPWDDETDMKELEKCVRSVVQEGLLWGSSKLVDLAYGIKKLQISCVVEDDKVSIEELSEKLQEFEDFVQSVDVAAFNKI